MVVCRVLCVMFVYSERPTIQQPQRRVERKSFKPSIIMPFSPSINNMLLFNGLILANSLLLAVQAQKNQILSLFT